MMMPRGQELLQPVNPFFMGLSLLLALALNLLPLGPVVWRPDMLLLLLGFWGVHQNQRISLGLAFVLGLCMDVQHTALLGQHALVYTALIYTTGLIYRRLSWLTALEQAAHMLLLFGGAHLLLLLVRLSTGGVFPGPWLALAPVIEALLWPLARWVLLAPQRRPVDADENRPL